MKDISLIIAYIWSFLLASLGCVFIVGGLIATAATLVELRNNIDLIIVLCCVIIFGVGVIMLHLSFNNSKSTDDKGFHPIHGAILGMLLVTLLTIWNFGIQGKSLSMLFNSTHETAKDIKDRGHEYDILPDLPAEPK